MMPTVWYVPIEPLVERYSAYWYNDIPIRFEAEGLRCQTIAGAELVNFEARIEHGEFLDVESTLRWKAEQTHRLLNLLTNQSIQPGDIIFFADLWHPGIESLFYYLDAFDRKDVVIAGILHAGVYDPNDFLTRKGMKGWGVGFERALLGRVDYVFVSTNYHKELIKKTHPEHSDVVLVTGLPPAWDYRQTYVPKRGEKENLVVFPHRLAPEKQPEVFQKAVNLTKVGYWNFGTIKRGKYELPLPEVIVPAPANQSPGESKTRYYSILRKARISVSAALQETWGIAMQESVLCGCIPLVPDRGVYLEMYPSAFRYYENQANSEEEALSIAMTNLIHKAASIPMQMDEIVQELRTNLIQKADQAIPNMVNVMLRS